MPSEQMNHEGSDAEVEDVVGRRKTTSNEHREDDKLEDIRGDRQQHRGAKVRSRRDSDVVVGHVWEPPLSVFT